MTHFESLWITSLAKRVSLLTFDQIAKTRNAENTDVLAMKEKIRDLEKITKNADSYFLKLLETRPGS